MSYFCFRIRVEKAGGGWCPKQQVEKGIREYIEVDLKDVHVITGVQTQGRYDRGRGQEYAEEYTLEYWRPGFKEWRVYRRWDGKEVNIQAYKYQLTKIALSDNTVICENSFLFV